MAAEWTALCAAILIGSALTVLLVSGSLLQYAERAAATIVVSNPLFVLPADSLTDPAAQR